VPPARNRARAQAWPRPVELPQGFLLPLGVLPKRRHRLWRRTTVDRRRNHRLAVLPPARGADPVRLSPALQHLAPEYGGTASLPLGRCSGWRASSKAACSILDSTGSRKERRIDDHIRLAMKSRRHASVRVRLGVAHRLPRLRHGRASPFARPAPQRGTAAVLNSQIAATAAFVTHGSVDASSSSALQRNLARRSAKTSISSTDRLATILTGGCDCNQPLMLCYAFQRGPVPPAWRHSSGRRAQFVASRRTNVRSRSAAVCARSPRLHRPYGRRATAASRRRPGAPR